MNSGSWAVTCCACAEAVRANAATEKINFFISVSLSLAPGHFHLPLVNCKVSEKGWSQTESSALIGLRIAIPPESSFGPPPRCVYIRNLSRPRSLGRERGTIHPMGHPCKIIERMSLRSS